MPEKKEFEMKFLLPEMSVRIVFATFWLFLSGCASYGSISNLHKTNQPSEVEYSLKQTIQSQRSSDITLVLAFSGGGTRAAALAYGVLQGLRDSSITLKGETHRLLDEIDLISSVSGGSFTAAYFGLYKDQIFTDFEDKFLRQNIEGALFSGLLSPSLWFSERGRTEMAIDHYDDTIFNGATFADILRQSGPAIVINASDLGYGVRFSFLQEYFDLLCSDLSSFPVARAVTASSAVPLLFNPVVLQNYDNCAQPTSLAAGRDKSYIAKSPQLMAVVDGLNSYARKDQRKYIHLVDGGLTDNLGLLAIYEMVEVAGGAQSFMDTIDGDIAQNFVVISVNASTKPQYQIDGSNKAPTVDDTINAASDVQLHRSNATTLELFSKSMKRWSAELSQPGKPVRDYFIEIDFRQIADRKRRVFVNQIPTSFSLQKEQVDSLIEAGRELLGAHPVFKKFLQDMNQ